MKSSAIAIVQDANSKYLLIKRADIPIWTLPGGGIEEGENPEDAAIREVEEETGIIAEIVRKTAIYDPVNWLSRKTHVFLCRQVGGTPRLSEETHSVGFYHLDEAPKPLFRPHKLWISDAQKNPNQIVRRELYETRYLPALQYLLRYPIISIQYLVKRFLKR